MTTNRSMILSAVRENPDLTTLELVPLCPRPFKHDNLNAEYLRHTLRILMQMDLVTRTSTRPSRWRIKHDEE